MKKDKNSVFINNFAGQLIECWTGIMQRINESDSQGNILSQEVPLVARGYFIDIDDDFLYLGDTMDGVSKAIKIGPGMIIELAVETNEFDNILDNMSINGNSN